MRILVYIHSLSNGGAERTTATLAAAWVERGHEVTVLTLSGTDKDAYVLPPQVRRIGLGLVGDSRGALAALRANVRRVRALRRLLREWQPHVAIALMPSAFVHLAIAARGLPVRAVGSERIHPPRHALPPIWRWLRKYAYRHLAGVVALTTPTAAWVRRHTRAVGVVVIPNVAQVPPSGKLPPLAPGAALAAGRSIALAVGRLTEQKGFDVLIDAFSAVAARHPQWDLVIIGDGPLRQTLVERANRRGVGERVKLPGAVGNVAQWYQAASLYVLSSRYEGFPNTLAEAMACGLPVIATDCETGPSDLVRAGVDGLLVPVDNPAALAEAMQRLMSDARLRATMGQRAREAADRFSLESVLRLWDRLFDQVLTTHLR